MSEAFHYYPYGVKASTDEIAVIQTRLPYTDRRALSEAWFSALHLASGDDPQPMRDVALRKAEHPPFGISSLCMKESSSAADGIVSRRSDARLSSGRASFEGELLGRARMSRSLRAHVAGASVSHARFSHVRFTLMIAGVRVALHVRGDGEKMIVIAVCSARRVGLVRRALAEAAAAMHLRGERVEMTVTAPDAKEQA
jgi:hypothetical protein